MLINIESIDCTIIHISSPLSSPSGKKIMFCEMFKEPVNMVTCLFICCLHFIVMSVEVVICSMLWAIDKVVLFLTD